MSVNVHTEWGKLKEIIVGSCIGISDINVELSFKLFFHLNIKDQILKNSISLQKKVIEQRQQDLDNLSDFLKSEGVVVHRPQRLDEVKKFNTPEFEDHQCPVDNPRDQVLIIGNQIIETSCQWRRRYFENDLMKDIFLKYFNEGAHWVCSPRPIMRNGSFDLSALSIDEQEKYPGYTGDVSKFEIMFDGAQCLKFGKDIVMNVSTQNHKLGAKWLKNHLGDKYNLHVIEITDHHIDGMFMPIRPGLLLINSTTMPSQIDKLPRPLQKWDHLVLPNTHQSNNSEDDIKLASQNINCNVLPIGQNEVIVFGEEIDDCAQLVKALKKHDVHAHPLRFRHSRLFGGGLHCATLDTVREETLEDYFS